MPQGTKRVRRGVHRFQGSVTVVSRLTNNCDAGEVCLILPFRKDAGLEIITERAAERLVATIACSAAEFAQESL